MNNLPLELFIEIIDKLRLEDLILLYQTDKEYQTLLNHKEVLNRLHRNFGWLLNRIHTNFMSLYNEYNKNWWKMYDDI